MAWHQRLGLALLFWAVMWMPGANEKGVYTAMYFAMFGTVLFVFPNVWRRGRMMPKSETEARKLLQEAQQKWPIEKICRRPWKANALMILDADGNTVMHLGGMSLNGKFADPFFLTSLAAFIVESVNKELP